MTWCISDRNQAALAGTDWEDERLLPPITRIRGRVLPRRYDHRNRGLPNGPLAGAHTRSTQGAGLLTRTYASKPSLHSATANNPCSTTNRPFTQTQDTTLTTQLITIAQLFLTQSIVELDRPEGYRLIGIDTLFDKAQDHTVRVQEHPPLQDTDRTASLTFRDGSAIVATRCLPTEPGDLVLWKIADATPEPDGQLRFPDSAEAPEWGWNHGQPDALAWARRMGQLLQEAAALQG